MAYHEFEYDSVTVAAPRRASFIEYPMTLAIVHYCYCDASYGLSAIIFLFSKLEDFCLTLIKCSNEHATTTKNACHLGFLSSWIKNEEKNEKTTVAQGVHLNAAAAAAAAHTNTHIRDIVFHSLYAHHSQTKCHAESSMPSPIVFFCFLIRFCAYFSHLDHIRSCHASEILFCGQIGIAVSCYPWNWLIRI